MSDIKIHGLSAATCTRRVLYAAALLNVPISLQPVNMATKEHKSPAFLKKQPFGKIPVLEQGDFILYESRAICRYLNDSISHTHSLIPQEPKSKALFEQWASLELGTYEVPINSILEAVVKPKYYGGEPDLPAARAAHEKLAPALTILDQQLEKHPYITGDSISLVDIFLTPALWMLQQMAPGDAKQIIDAHPHIAAWWKRVTETAEWQSILKAP